MDSENWGQNSGWFWGRFCTLCKSEQKWDFKFALQISDGTERFSPPSCWQEQKQWPQGFVLFKQGLQQLDRDPRGLWWSSLPSTPKPCNGTLPTPPRCVLTPLVFLGTSWKLCISHWHQCCQQYTAFWGKRGTFPACWVSALALQLGHSLRLLQFPVAEMLLTGLLTSRRGKRRAKPRGKLVFSPIHFNFSSLILPGQF